MAGIEILSRMINEDVPRLSGERYEHCPEKPGHTNLIKFWLMRDFPFIDFVVHHGKGDLPCLLLYPFAVILMLPACAALRCNVQTTAGYDDFRHWLLSTMACSERRRRGLAEWTARH